MTKIDLDMAMVDSYGGPATVTSRDMRDWLRENEEYHLARHGTCAQVAAEYWAHQPQDRRAIEERGRAEYGETDPGLPTAHDHELVCALESLYWSAVRGAREAQQGDRFEKAHLNLGEASGIHKALVIVRAYIDQQ